MKFTKILALTLAVLMACFCLVSCTEEAKDGGAAVENEAPAENKDEAKVNDEAKVDDEAPAVEGEAPVADDAVEAEKLVMATNAYFQPYEYYEGKEIVGIDAEIAAAIAEKLGMELEIKDMQFDSIITAVQTGSVDFGMAGLTITDERKESVDFTSSYATGVQSIIVKEGSAIKSVDDLYADGASYKVGVQLGTTGDNYSTDDFGKDNVARYPNGNEAVMALAGGEVDCVIIDNQPALALVEANEGLTILDTSYAVEEYAICVAKGNTELLTAMNAAIDELIADGTIDAIIVKYIK